MQKGKSQNSANVETEAYREEAEITFQQSFCYTRKQKATVLTIGLAAVIALPLHGLFNGSSSLSTEKQKHNKDIFRAISAMTALATTLCDKRLEAPFTAIFSGLAVSGETQLLKEVIERASVISDVPPVDIVYCYGTYQDSFIKINQLVTLHQGSIKIKEIPIDR